MSVRIGKVTAIRLKPYKSGTLKANGTEQTVVEYSGLGKIIGYIDLQNMQAGDTVVIRMYVKLKSDGNYKKYDEGTYTGVQSKPVIYIRPKESHYGVKVTLQQTAGVMREFDYNFLEES